MMMMMLIVIKLKIVHTLKRIVIMVRDGKDEEYKNHKVV